MSETQAQKLVRLAKAAHEATVARLAHAYDLNISTTPAGRPIGELQGEEDEAWEAFEEAVKKVCGE